MQHHRSHSIIEQFISRLRQQVQVKVQHHWRDITSRNIVNHSHNLDQVNLDEYPTPEINDKGYLILLKGRQVKWLAQKIVIPTRLQDYPISGLTLRLVLTWWAEEAQVFINGKLVQEGDLFDSSARVVITDDAKAGEEYLVTICLTSPNHDIGALMRSHLLYEELYLPENVDPGLVADELTILYKYLGEFQPEHLEVLTEELNKFNWSNIQNADRFFYDLQKLRSSLLPLGKDIKQRCFNLLGHAHLDMAWLWTTEETKEVAQRTFKSVLSLQQNFPALTFGHTSPALYEWIERDNPELFIEIQNAVRLNKWELLGGMWIEPETNLVSGESLIRQLIYGQQYYQEKFGEISKVAWLPDSFGFTWQLPQILKQCGIEYFVTGKLHWNDRTKFPHGCFWWESPDGTRLLTLMSPPNVTGVMDTNPITMTNYAIDWETQTGLQDIFWLPGVGDHGGGPTKDMLEVADKWNNSPFFPEIKFTKAIDYLTKISQSPSLQVWQDELYLELHRGCYTVRGEQKKYNRYCERLLYEAELWSSLATLLCGDRFVFQPLFPSINIFSRKEDICQSLIETAWKKVLFNQFHDILPGTSIPEVFTEANQDWEGAIAIGEGLLEAALKAIASSIELPAPPQADAKPIIVFNSLNWERSQEVTIEDEVLESSDLDFWIRDELGNSLCIHSKQKEHKLTFLAQNIPSIGYRLYWLCWGKIVKEPRVTINAQVDYELVNIYLTVVIDPKTGNIESIFDNRNKREILSKQGNELQFFEDKGQYWDAWNIDPEYEQKQLPNAELRSIEWIDAGLTKGIKVVKKFNKSTFTQDYILEYNSPILKIVNKVDWQETHVMVKAAFSLTIESNRATYEIPCGTIERTTQPQTETEKAKWEVSALNWADITDQKENYGVSLLNNCKYGYDAKPNLLRLTLLRAATWPDPKSDRGFHHFTYALYPHKSNWQTAKTVQQGSELNTPLQTIVLELNRENNLNYHKLPSTSQLLKLSSDNLILMALKFSKNQELIMRCYEAWGESSELKIISDLNLQLKNLVDCLENEGNSEITNNSQIEPYKIITGKLFKYST
ncbi:alpha-mannosidase [Waterburya agarophytonicola K14]|uniref:Alpha-mannosidase n=1 Tax=Waterburya agarophytonicola KI4 TaxID=2874699 RepID=A0A964BQI2_9CYAN|nr:alpha-mannosidase [Waterburya agarophytonicola]MCC0176045.1 alpha-mannosidase [Waterburya agarophytonicola KI4]